VVESFRIYGDAECGHIEPGIVYKDICILYAEEERDNKHLLGRLVNAVAVPGQYYVRDCC
jgi:hypothetical protein